MIRDTLFLVGFACMSWGFYLAWPPLGWIVPGVVVMVLCAMARPQSGRKPPNAA